MDIVPPAVVASILLCATPVFGAETPRLYSQPAYESPVHGGPDDLLLLAGTGLSNDETVVYVAATSGGEDHPPVVPSSSTAEAGTASIVSALGAPYQVTVRLPPTLLSRHAYRLWVKTRDGEWSNGVNINDLRPLWVSPPQIYSSDELAHLPRMLKIIGRNMHPSDPVVVRLTGPEQYELHPTGGRADSAVEPPPSVGDPAANEMESGSTVLDDYVLQAELPRRLAPGQYRVDLRTGSGRWVSVPGQTLSVLGDPAPTREFPVSEAAFGGCRPDDGEDDTICAAKALEAARQAGGGAVVFGAGTWDLHSGALTVPLHVDVRGRGMDRTRLVRHDVPNAPPNTGEFVLLGHNRVEGITFADAYTFDPRAKSRPILQLGRRYNTDEQPQSMPTLITDVVITYDAFDRTYGAIVDGGSPIERLFVTHNQVGDYRMGLYLGGNPFNVRGRFGLADSVIAHNRFMPGSYVDLTIQQGAMASELGAAHRVDFSSNVADGTSTAYLNSPQDPSGWRAAFFWHLLDSQEMLLISENDISCSGDKAGDGEAISLDNNVNTYALPSSVAVTSASDDSVTVSGPLIASQNHREIDVRSYYVGHWLRIDSGPGIGQSRKITAYSIADGGASVTFIVAPGWDVAPAAQLSTVSIARTYWQTLILDNHIDQRKPRCRKGNQTRPKGGNISVWAQASDSVVAGNRQYDTDGVLFQQGYGAEEQGCAQCGVGFSIPSFLEISENLVEGEYDWQSSCSLSGIMGSYASAPNSPRLPPPLLSIGVRIAHNRVVHADSLYGGGINIVPTWFRGPAGYKKPLLLGIAIDHNDITDISGPTPRTECNYVQRGRYGIAIQGDGEVHGTVLYQNRCDSVTTPLLDRGAETRRLCDRTAAPSCECNRVK
jgi:hypothetical protein